MCATGHAQAARSASGSAPASRPGVERQPRRSAAKTTSSKAHAAIAARNAIRLGVFGPPLLPAKARR